MNISPSDVLVRAMRTPNPMALKFVVNFPLKTQGKASFLKKDEGQAPPLVKSLFAVPGAHQIHVFENQLTLSHNGELSFKEMEDQAAAIIREGAAAHDPGFQPPQEEKPDRGRLPERWRRAEEVLDRTIRPGLQADGGDLEIVSFEGSRMEISYQGACGGCPSSYMGTLEAIENILRYELRDDELEVAPV